jgi:hypothetical protein
MKKIISKTLIISVLFALILPVIFSNFKAQAANEWYFTKTNNLLYNFSSGAVNFISGGTSLAECTSKRNATPSVANYTLGPCTEKVEAPTGEGWGYNVDTKTAPSAANNPIGFKTEENCNINRGEYLDSDIHKKDVSDGYFVSIGACIYKKGISNDGVVNVSSTANNIGASENKTRYNFLVPIGNLTCMDWGTENATTKECIGNNIGDYLNIIFKIGIGLCAAIAVIMLIIYGIMYMGDESVFGKTEAKKKMFSAIFGLIIALGAWAILNTINPALTGKNGLLFSGVSIDAQPNSIYVKEVTPQNTARCTPVTSGPCTVTNLSIFGSQAESMSKICNIESSGNPNAVSGTDKGTDGRAFSFGLFQINLLANGKIIKDSTGATCEGLFVRTSDGKPTPPNKYINNGTYDAKLKTGMESKYDDCKKTLLDPTKNIEAAKLLSNSTLSAWRGSDIKVCPSAFN